MPTSRQEIIAVLEQALPALEKSAAVLHRLAIPPLGQVRSAENKVKQLLAELKRESIGPVNSSIS